MVNIHDNGIGLRFIINVQVLKDITQFETQPEFVKIFSMLELQIVILLQD